MAFLRRLNSVRPQLCAYSQHRGCSIGVLKYSEEVARAREVGGPIVALESTIITHGMPYPQNLETALQVEDIIRSRGATPATIAILSGQLTIGLSKDQLEYLAQVRGVVKASRRDMAPVMAAKQDGATTVAGTIIAAELADIPVFVTGGIGGVHRHGENTMDISADLTELGRSRTLVVCSGVKSILDIGRTLEYLETQGVCVCSFGESQDFPAFYTPRSGHRAPHRAPDAAYAARLLHASRTLRLGSGVVVAVPIPQEYAMDEVVIDGAIQSALAEARLRGITGKEVTPFILSAVAAATSGASLNANIALIKKNAKVGADIAVALHELRNVGSSQNVHNIGLGKNSPRQDPLARGFHTSNFSRVANSERKYAAFSGSLLPAGTNVDEPILVIGGANVDRTYRITEGDVKLDGSTHPCLASVCGGGVARNMAEALWKLRGPGSVRLLTAVGDDPDGRLVADIAPGLLLPGCTIEGGRTANYAAVLDCHGECILGLGDMTLHNEISIQMVDRNMEALEKAPLVVLDANAPQETVNHVLKLCNDMNKAVFFEPTDKRKADKPLLKKHRITMTFPNLKELRAMANSVSKIAMTPNADIFDEILVLGTSLSQLIDCIVVTIGAKGLVVITNNLGVHSAKHYVIEAISSPVNVSGAGDCFASGFIHGFLSGFTEDRCVTIGLEAAKAALLSEKTVPHNFKLNEKLSASKFKELLC